MFKHTSRDVHTETVDVTNLVLNFVSCSCCVVKVCERFSESDDVKEQGVGFAQFTGVNASKPDRHEE